MTRLRERFKGRRESLSFVQLPHALIDSENWHQLSPFAVKLFVDLYGQFRGQNNGDFTAAWSVMKPKGWRSKATLSKALRELEWFGFVECTRVGGRNRASLYGVTFKAIDECGGKLDLGPTKVASGKWRDKVGPFPGVVSHPRRSTKSMSLPHEAGYVASPRGTVTLPVHLH